MLHVADVSPTKTVETAAMPLGTRSVPPEIGQIVLVLQGGGALGACQAGAYEALHEAGIEPDWVIGTSIGAINAALIAGNPREQRIARLEEFWRRIRHGMVSQLVGTAPWVGPTAAKALTFT